MEKDNMENIDTELVLATDNSTDNSIVTAETKILVAEDDDHLRKMLLLTLQREGYTVTAVNNGQAALEAFAADPADIVILDINMPIMDGYTTCTELRKRTDVPIIMLTARSRTDDVVMGFGLGADNYMTKPFELKELRARIQAILRRMRNVVHRKRNANLLAYGDISLDKESHLVNIRGQEVNLTPGEYRLLEYLMQNPDRLISKEELLHQVWEYQSNEDMNFVRVTVRRLRSKIEEDAAEPLYLKTVHGTGYQFCTTATRDQSDTNKSAKQQQTQLDEPTTSFTGNRFNGEDLEQNVMHLTLDLAA
jgi:DNA-binding response OmpR family regulator